MNLNILTSRHPSCLQYARCLLAKLNNTMGRVVNTGHSSAASFPTGPVIADPFISPFGLTICKIAASACYCSKAATDHSNVQAAAMPISPSFQYLLMWGPPKQYKSLVASNSSTYARVITHHTSVVLKVQVHSIRPPPRLALPYHHSRHNLFSQLRLSLLDCSHHHIANTGSGKTVETGTDAFDGDDVEISSAAVVAAIHNGATVENKSLQIWWPARDWRAVGRGWCVHWETESHLQFIA